MIHIRSFVWLYLRTIKSFENFSWKNYNRPMLTRNHKIDWNLHCCQYQLLEWHPAAYPRPAQAPPTVLSLISIGTWSRTSDVERRRYYLTLFICAASPRAITGEFGGGPLALFRKQTRAEWRPRPRARSAARRGLRPPPRALSLQNPTADLHPTAATTSRQAGAALELCGRGCGVPQCGRCVSIVQRSSLATSPCFCCRSSSTYG